MNVHIVTAVYGLPEDSENLIRTAVSQQHGILWHVFVHSRFGDVQKLVKRLERREDIRVYNYGVNRGIARSWNEGIIEAFRDGADFVILANDDISLREGDLDLFIEGAAEIIEGPEHLISHVTCWGHDVAMGKDTSMRFGFVAITRTAWEVVGCFDESFMPMYFEDVDWVRRAKLSGMTAGSVDSTYLTHRGSANIREVPGLMEQNKVTFPLNQKYYERKWGAGPNHERFTRPFNDVRFGLRIAESDRERPYWGYERHDLDELELM